MELTEHYARLERLYHAAACNQSLAPEMRIDDGRARVRIAVTPDMLHTMNGVHGAFYFKALDDAAFFAANSVVTDVFVLTVSFTVQFLRPVSEGALIAEGRLVKTGSLLFADSVLKDTDERQLARGAGVFARSRHSLPGV